MKISIIIPVLNEENSISKLLDYLHEIQNPEFTNEIIIVDGGSDDNTLKILENYPKIKVFNCLKGRAKQMNFGAKNANSEILYFLHCDTFPPKNFDSEIVNQVNHGNISGCFKMKFDNNHIVLKVSQWFTRFNFQAFRGGDQSLFVECKLFKKINGFDENLIIYEDNKLIARLYKNSKFVVIQKSVITSARKYLKNGIWTLQFHFLMIHIKYSLGSSQEDLVDYYQRNIKI
jgi:rSAM/selenodomain-associated transferase 2